MRSVAKLLPRTLLLRIAGLSCGIGFTLMPYVPGNIEAGSSKAARVLDLYEGFWNEIQLGPADYVLSADEKTSIQTRIRKHKTMIL